MGSISPKAFQAKTGQRVLVRTAEPDEAAAVLEFALAIAEEDAFSITQPDEFDVTEEEERHWIEQHMDDPGQIALVAEISDQIVGLLFFENGVRRRLAHRGMFYMSVGREHRSQGIGTALLETLLEWACESPIIEKVGLSVLSKNRRAIGLYEKLGFVAEGRRSREVKLAPGEYLDDISMCRFV